MDTSRIPILNNRSERFQSYDGTYNSPNTIGTLARVSKQTARKLYDDGVQLIIVTSKYLPFPLQVNGTAMYMRKPLNKAYSFDTFVNGYAVYNCNWETGYYPTFWVQYKSRRELGYTGKHVVSL